jgi:subtilisin
MVRQRPAYSSAFASDAMLQVDTVLPRNVISPDWAWGGSTGRGVKVAVIDSGVDAGHPEIAGRVHSYVSFAEGPDGITSSTEPHVDSFGHGTACAGVILSIAPEVEIYSVKVLGGIGAGGSGAIFAAGLRWAIENGMQVCNLSLGTTKRDFFATFHELADLAYFRNVLLITAANNMPIPSFPSVYASVVSVAAHEGKDPYLFYYNPQPPVEFGAPGIDVRLAWAERRYIQGTGNSYAAPHITGIAAKIIGKHPGMTVFQMKTVLQALSANVSGEGRPREASQ